MNKLKKFILDNDIVLIITTPSSRILTIINLLNTFSIEDNYKTHLFNFNISSNYYTQKLINFLSGINTRLVSKYQYPYATLSKRNNVSINRDKYIEAIETIQKSNIIMRSNDLTNIVSDVLIIDDFYALTNMLQTDYNNTLDYMKNLANHHTVIFKNMKKIDEDTILKYKKLIPNLVVIDGKNYGTYKEVNVKIVSDKENILYSFKSDKNNQIKSEESK